MTLDLIERLHIRRLETDSRRVRRGDTFVAYPGETQDGRRYIGQALERGAHSVLWEQRGFRWRREWRAPNLGVTNLRARAGVIASKVYGEPSEKLWMVGVTGTNGKTTCSQWLAQAFRHCGRRSAVIGTLGYGTTRLKPLVNTTPDAVWLHAQLRDFHRAGVDAVAMEVSSIGLDQDRVAGVDFDCALFTNLTRDHLDYHGTMRRYRRAKLKLFERRELAHAILNFDDAFGRAIAGQVKRRGLALLGYGFGMHADVKRVPRVAGANLHAGAAGMQFDVRTPWGSARVESALIGRHNAWNLLGTLATLLASDIRFEDAVATLRKLKPAAGRMQKIGGGRRPLTIVDYAHSPDALEQALTSLRDLASGTPARIICVFGCGGDRDRGKRAQMGAIATRFADCVVITNDNPRTENPRRIIADIRQGASGDYIVEPDRRRAIAAALKEAKRGDIVLIAGKGHEAYQEINGVRHPFSDMAVARAALRRLHS